MPRGSNLTADQVLMKALILGDPKAGKTEWALKAAESGFNVLYMDGDVAAQTISAIAPESRDNIFYLDVADKLDGGIEPRMIEAMSDFMTASRLLWNDSKQRVYSRVKDEHDPESGACLDEIWEFRPAKLNHRWVFVVDSWTTLSYSAMLAKALAEGIDLADVDKIDRSLYQGVGNRLTNMLSTIQKMPCHVIVIGHPDQYEKRKSQSGVTVKEGLKENDQIIEWTKMIPKSSSKPHGLTMGKFFSDIGWIDIDKFGKRKINFTITSERVSGGHLAKAGDPRLEGSFASLVKSIGGTIPEKSDDLGEGLIIHLPGTYIPAASAAKPVLGGKSPASNPTAAPSVVRGLGGLASLKK